MQESARDNPGNIPSGAQPPVCDGYRVVQQIGEGSYGTVWLADDAVGKRIALKVIDRRRLGPSSSREERAVRLVRTRLPDHPNLVRIEHVGMSADLVWYAMELADSPASSAPDSNGTYAACSLHSVLASRGHLEPIEALGVVRAILAALDCLHSHHLVHRDVKPSNVLLIGGVWKLADIGLVTEHGPEITSVGTVDFQPSTGPLDATADLFAVGRVLYCLFTGNPARSFPALPGYLLVKDRRRGTAIINDLVLRACAADPARRFTTAAEFLDAVDGAERRLSVPYVRRRLSRIAAITLCMFAIVAVAIVARNLSGASDRVGAVGQETAGWIRLFDGQTLVGWVWDESGRYGTWSVKDGMLNVVRDSTFKSIDTVREFGYGRYRATVVPGHDGARLGLSFGTPKGSMFLLMGDKYTWIAAGKDPTRADEPGKWRSFPGPVPKAGEPVVMEVDFGPDRTRFFANGTFLDEVPGTDHLGRLGLHVWGNDSGSFQDVMYQPAPR